MRYRIYVYGRRGDQPAYRYTQVERCKASKVERLLLDTAADVAGHESRGDYSATIYNHGSGFIVRVGICKFIIRKVRI
jgi:hypothetical protein